MTNAAVEEIENKFDGLSVADKIAVLEKLRTRMEREDSVSREPGHYAPSGVDLSLLRYMRSLSPLERVVLMEQHARDVETLLEYGRKHRETKAAKNR
jgi:hypothetical protein